MVFGPNERGHRIDRSSPHVIVRRLEGVAGTVDVSIQLAPRAGYGLTEPVLVGETGGLRSRGGPFSAVISTDIPLDLRESDAAAVVRINAGDIVHFALLVASPWEEPPPFFTDAEMADVLEATIAGWRSWSGLHQSYDGPYAEMVRLSGRVLQALTYAPTGAVVAAPTTSLPETVGGSRNWDYRFCWVRDASLTLEALWVAACPDEAAEFFTFLATAAGGRLRGGKDLQILYGVGAERLVPEHELAHLGGYRDSRPVRIGNGAWDQVQLDVYGELLSAAWLLADQVGDFDPVTARFLIDVADTAAARWAQADQGIWEVRGEPRHFVYSKLMCWVALDRAVRLAEMVGAEDRLEHWTASRDAIRVAVEANGWSERAGAFGQSFGSDDLDASNLMLLLAGFLPASDPRMRSTVDAIADRLTDERGFVFRYRADDGLAGEEGAFTVCTFWLVQYLAELGEVARARQLFERVTSFANDVGLFSEELNSATGEAMGNFPQAFTHIGLVNASRAIARAEGVVSSDAGPTQSTPDWSGAQSTGAAS